MAASPDAAGVGTGDTAPAPVVDLCGELPQAKRDFPEELERWPVPVDIEAVAEEMAAIIRRHCVLTPAETDSIVLWTISSYGINAFGIFPRLSLISPEKRCGKSTVMEIITAISRNGLMTSNISTASLFRLSVIAQVTLLLDEADTFVKNGPEELRGIINSGHRQAGAYVTRCEGDNHQPRVYSTWMPMVLASIGDLPSTIMDRSIVVRLRRKAAGDSVERLPSDMLSQLTELRRKLATWVFDNMNDLKTQTVTVPSHGNDRAADNWLPLFTVASLISPDWERRCAAAYGTLEKEPTPELPTRLLQDIKEWLATEGVDRFRSQDLVSGLIELDGDFWRHCNGARPINPALVSELLSPYGIKPKAMKFAGKTLRGYESVQFTDAFKRYLQR